MSYYSFNFLQNINYNNKQLINNNSNNKNYYDKNMNYYICSFGGCGSTILTNYLSNFGNVFHIHDRYPPTKLKYVGKNNTDKDVYSEWFNDVDVPDSDLKKYKIIYIYRNPLYVIFSRFAKPTGPNIPHLKHIMCDNDGNIALYDILHSNQDLYKIEEFFDNYCLKKERNYPIYCVKYENFWGNISLFNKVIGIPDIKELYPRKYETPRKIYFENKLNIIYNNLLQKMNRMGFIEVV
jgi:hypothetical protein